MAAEWDEAVGSVAQETARLLEALVAGAAPAAGGAQEPTDEEPTDEAPTDEVPPTAEERRAHEHVPMGSAQTCSWCPVCRGIQVVRGLSPDTLRSLADVAALAATTLTDLATRRTEARQGAPGATEEPAADAGTRRVPAGRRVTVEEVPVVPEPVPPNGTTPNGTTPNGREGCR